MIAREGRKLLIGLLVATVGFRIIGNSYDLNWMIILYFISGFMFLFSLNFFRDPKRIIPEGEDILIAPADGKIVRIKAINDPDVGKGTLVSVFLNVFNVHVNRVPVTGIVKSITYRPGKFLAAFNHKASDENEQTVILMESSQGPVKIKQIAGLIARRIYCYAKEGITMKKGDRLGFIMFGSRTDVIFPYPFQVLVEEGQKVVGGETVIGQYK